MQLDPPTISSSAAVATSSLVPSADGSREKTYNFDNVFGPEADQGMVYQSVVTPVLAEVMRGYNCTVFAYGQTGTGKTHTMEGDLTSQMGTYSSEAGIIPRTLYRLFHQLELSGNEYAVHASFVELYNEELRDLLSSEAPKPLSSGGLKVYDDKAKGIVIYGLEDTPVRDAVHGLDLLRRGSHKRQIAATKCNENSSRSHSVFTLTVHMKETTSKGEDVLRVGKLNLVDLAGSENIGRSGAENKRAREAGMINQSLLTLGRVINALVEKSSHVPYRESKLTRLLQESLGGRTKTCIIATVSAEKANLEETVSTLDYALRAKSIRNRPEMNSRMTRAGLIMEYVKEIERLKRDILAARGKEGFYVSSESWKEIQDEGNAQKTAADELRRLVEVAESKRESLQEQFEQNMQMLGKRDTEVKAIKLECAEKKRELDVVIDQAKSLEAALTEETELREAYRNSERKLHKIASSLRSQAQENQDDLGGLFAKLERKTRVEQTNQKVVNNFQQVMQDLVAGLEQQTTSFDASYESFTSTLNTDLRSFAAAELASLRSTQQDVQDRRLAVAALTQDLDQEHKASHANVQDLVGSIEQSRRGLEQTLEEQSRTLDAEWASARQKLGENFLASSASMKKTFHGVCDMVVSMVKQAQTHIAAENDKLAELRAFAVQASQREVDTLRSQNRLLTSLLEDERSKTKSMQDKLRNDVMALLTEYTEARDRNLTEAVTSVQTRISASEADATAFAQGHSERLDALTRASDVHEQYLVEKELAVKKARKRGDASLDSSKGTTDAVLSAWTATLEAGSRCGLESAMEMEQDVAQAGKQATTQADACQRAQKERLEQLSRATQDTFDVALEQLDSTIANVDSASQGAASSIADHREVQDHFSREVSSHLSAMREQGQTHLEDYYAQDIATGDTPQRKDIGAAMSLAHWKLVPGTRQKALEQYRHLLAKKQANMGAARPSAAHSVGTLPDDTRLSEIEDSRAHDSLLAGDDDASREQDDDDDEENEEDEELEDSLRDIILDSDDTVKLGGLNDGKLSAFPSNHMTTTTTMTTSAAIDRPLPRGTINSRIASQPVYSGNHSRQASSTRPVLAEKNIDANVDATQPGKGSTGVKPVNTANVGLRKPTAASRRLTKA